VGLLLGVVPRQRPRETARVSHFDPVKAKIPSNLTPQIAKRAYELYEQQGHREGHAVQDWGQAEREIRKEESLK